MCPKNAPSGASLALALVVVLACAGAARFAAADGDADATTLEPSLQLEQQYNSNIFSQEKGEEQSPVTILRPGLTFRNAGERGFLRLNGWLSNHSYWQESKLNGTDRGGMLDFDRRLTSRLSFFGSGTKTRYVNRDEIRGSDIAVRNDEGQVEIVPGHLVSGGAPDIDTEAATLGVRYDFTPRTTLQLSGGPTNVAYNRHPVGSTTYRDRAGWFARSLVAYELSPRDQLSLDVQALGLDQDDATAFFFKEPAAVTIGAGGFELVTVNDNLAVGTGESRSEQQLAMLGWGRSWSPVWYTRFSVGARRLHSEVEDAWALASTAARLCILTPFGCFPTGTKVPATTFTPVDFDDTGPGVIGEVLLRRTFERSLLTLSYRRSTEVNSGATTSDVDVDTFTVELRRLLAQRVTLQLTGKFEYLENASDRPQLVPATFDAFDPLMGANWSCPQGSLQVIGSGSDSLGQCEIGTSTEGNGQRLTLGARIDWQLRKRLGSYVVIRYYDQMGDPGVSGSDYNKYTIGVGFRYAYDLEL